MKIIKTIGLVILLGFVVGCEELKKDYQVKICADFCVEHGLMSHPIFEGESIDAGLWCNCWGYAVEYEEPKP